ncbi:MAG: DUF3365 domain-containing protein [Methylotenera sp.]|nr:DUF3365 domain-containing protein [Methylotenera sp.]MDO9234103.1 DUF3365 domain-containing protein [Methylotenera sp.]MDO9388319.1 DUF3365 domain-containing protein [Methylotenera sp.]MDP2101657.1 DUF3365 domain-containing protein [Methylotenera sp.]MDP2280863.1 DUF3365 domain-containing protein [Methylotenera sp.]
MNNIILKTALVLVVLTVPACATKVSNEATTAKYLEESRNTALEFRKKLGGVQKAQLESVGAENAIPVCKVIAPAMAAEYSQNGQILKRVSLKARNKALGTPDTWEKEVLEGFDKAQLAGKPVDVMEASTVSKEADGRWFRYVKAIPTQPQCLQCHGKPNEISAGMKALLAREYPEDMATGYSVGEIRGAISIKRKVN